MRCSRDAADAKRRARRLRAGIVAAALAPVACAALLWALLAPAPVESPPELIATDVMLNHHRPPTPLGVEPFGPGSSRVTSPATHQVLQAWEDQLAQAERQADLKEKADREGEARQREASRLAIWKNLGPTPVTPTWATVAPRPFPQTPPTVAAPPSRAVRPPGVAAPPRRYQAPVQVQTPVALPDTVIQPPHHPVHDPPLPPACPGGRMPSHLRRVLHPPHLDAPPPRVITEGFPVGVSL